VRCTLTETDPAGQRFALPAWIPGSYMIRDFARHIVRSRRSRRHQARARSTRLDKHTWQAAPWPNDVLTVRCEIHAWDLSVRGAHVDRRMPSSTAAAFSCARSDTNRRPAWSTSSGRSARRSRTGASPPRCPGEGEKGTAARRHGFGLYRAANYDELIDHPVEMGTFSAACTFKPAACRTRWRSAAATIAIRRL
jgi:predicted metalloprotease with PDZ domain